MDHLIRILSSFTNYEKTRDFHKGRVRLDLKKMERLSRAAGDPHLKIPCIHITGSKGKGSTALMVSAILTASGLRTGTFTSPHLSRLNERIAVNGEPLSDESFLLAADQGLDLLREDAALSPTFFEFITLTAMLAFLSQEVEAAVYEVGLGGRLDATNVVRPEVAVITTVEREHCAVLGHTEEAIAHEKAGILKAGVPVVTAVPAECPARAVIEERAAELGAPLFGPGAGLWVGEGTVVEFRGERLGPFQPPRPGTLQTWNLAAALAAARIFLERTERDWRSESVDAAMRDLKLPCRFEMVNRSPPIIVDGAHTLHSIQATVREAKALFSSDLVVILGLAADKEVEAIVQAVAGMSPKIIFTSYPGGRAEDPLRLQALAGGAGSASLTPKGALERARSMASDSAGILVTGSFYLAGVMRQLVTTR